MCRETKKSTSTTTGSKVYGPVSNKSLINLISNNLPKERITRTKTCWNSISKRHRRPSSDLSMNMLLQSMSSVLTSSSTWKCWTRTDTPQPQSTYTTTFYSRFFWRTAGRTVSMQSQSIYPSSGMETLKKNLKILMMKSMPILVNDSRSKNPTRNIQSKAISTTSSSFSIRTTRLFYANTCANPRTSSPC